LSREWGAEFVDKKTLALKYERIPLLAGEPNDVSHIAGLLQQPDEHGLASLPSLEFHTGTSEQPLK
jgi:hypothetical protein